MKLIKRFILVKESTALKALIVFLILVPTTIKLYQYFASKVDTKHHQFQSLIKENLDSLIKIETNIQIYDSINQTNQKVNRIEFDSDEIDLSNKYFSTENSDDDLALLEKKKDSLSGLIEKANSDIAHTVNILDSISPKYTVEFRDLIESQKTVLEEQLLVSLRTDIESTQQNISFFKFMQYFIYGFPIILYPFRWILLFFYKRTPLFKK